MESKISISIPKWYDYEQKICFFSGFDAQFQFQNGTIMRSNENVKIANGANFNSKMVRL